MLYLILSKKLLNQRLPLVKKKKRWGELKKKKRQKALKPSPVHHQQQMIRFPSVQFLLGRSIFPSS